MVLVGPLGCVYHLSGTLSNSNRWFLFFSLSLEMLFSFVCFCVTYCPLLVLTEFYDDMDGGSWGDSTGWVFFFFFLLLPLFVSICLYHSLISFFLLLFFFFFRHLGMFVLHLHLILLHPLGLGSLVMEMGIL